MALTTAMGGRLATPAHRASSFWDLLLAITIRDLRVKYHGTILSYLWWIARPLTLGLVLYFALGRVLKINVPHHGIFLLSALFPWFWFQGALSASTAAFITNNGLMKKVQFPHLILPLSVVLGATFEFIATLPVLIVLVIADGITPSWMWLPGIAILLVLQFLLLAGLGTLAAVINVFFRDLAPGLDSALTLLFYVSPIIYPLDKVPARVKPVLLINPLASLIDAWRGVFMDGALPGLDVWPAVAFTAIAIVAGLTVLRALGRDMVDAL